MATISATHVPHNTGWAGDLKKGQVIRITATTTVDFVFFRLQNLRERFDQDTPKVYDMKLFISAGENSTAATTERMMRTDSKTAPTIAEGMSTDFNWRSRKVAWGTLSSRLLKFPITAATRTIEVGCRIHEAPARSI